MAVQPSIFARSPLLARIPEEDLRALLKFAEERRFAAGQVLFQRGDPGDGVYAIVSGRVRVYLEGADGSEAVLAMRGPGEVIGEQSLLDGLERSASAAAHDAVTAVRIGTDRFQAWLLQHPHVARALLIELSRRLREATDHVAELALLSVDARVARRLLQLFGEQSRDGAPAAGAQLRMSQSDLALLVGVTRESVNKHLARWKASGVLAIEPGRLVLHDPAALRALAEEI